MSKSKIEKHSLEEYRKRKVVPTRLQYEDYFPSSGLYETPASISYLKSLNPKLQKKKIYFAHSTTMIGTKKEKKIIEILENQGYEVINPFDKEKEICEKYGVLNYYDKPSKPFAEDIEKKAEQLVNESDEYFGWFEGMNSYTFIGTTSEMNWAFKDNKKITVIIKKPHPFVFNRADIIYLSFEDFVKDNKFYEKEN